jgi:site-specific DNA-methyltransferase (adenine-specific)
MNKLYQGDCLEVMDKLIADGVKVDAIITDPPYELTARGSHGTMGGDFWKDKKTKSGKVFDSGYVEIADWINRVYALLKDGTHFYVMCNDKNLLKYLQAIDRSDFKFVKTIIWEKPNKICGRWYMTQKETIILARKGKARPINNAGTSDILHTPNFKKIKLENGKNAHDTEKPVELMEVLVANSSNGYEIILDPFMGSGTTGVACKNLNRNFIGIELDEKYFKIAEDRINELE